MSRRRQTTEEWGLRGASGWRLAGGVREKRRVTKGGEQPN